MFAWLWLEQVADHGVDLCVLSLQALNDLVDAVAEVKALQERNADADRSAQVEVSVEVMPPQFTITTFLLFPQQTVTDSVVHLSVIHADMFGVST